MHAVFGGYRKLGRQVPIQGMVVGVQITHLNLISRSDGRKGFICAEL